MIDVDLFSTKNKYRYTKISIYDHHRYKFTSTLYYQYGNRNIYHRKIKAL